MNDQAAYHALVSYWITLERYVALVLLVSGLHTLAPLEAELFEVVDCYLALSAWGSTALLPALALALFALYCAILLNLGVAWAQTRLLLGLLGGLLGALAAGWALLVWDCVGNALSSAGWFADQAAFYHQAKTPLALNQLAGVADVFDWHRAAPQARALRFEDLFLFLLELLCVMALTVALAFWFWVLVDVAQAGRGALTHNTLGAGARLLAHGLTQLVSGWLGLYLLGLRILARLPFEAGLL